ncbi:MAG: tRNA 2-thiouridine(34) synthase MnmA [Desulfarculaceae bacterium]
MGVALSGGVDSSVAALLLREKGHELIGLSLRLGQGLDKAWQQGGEAAQALGIHHQVVDVRADFRSKVLKPVVEAYAGGMTPNPCALCNAGIKFPLLWAAAKENGCQALATGHYVRCLRAGDRYLLAESLDRNKSQAYFLARVSQDLLPRLCFPLGALDKAQVREIAVGAGLMASGWPESQDVCFLPPGGWDELMEEHGAVRGGVVEDQQGRCLGSHTGLHRFTVGQRRGLGVALGSPRYVLALDGKRAAVTVGRSTGLMAAGLWGSKAVWHLPPEEAGNLKVRIRYAHTGAECRVARVDGRVRVDFFQPQRAVAPGQLAVFFDRDHVVGSAWIDEAIL